MEVDFHGKNLDEIEINPNGRFDFVGTCPVFTASRGLFVPWGLPFTYFPVPPSEGPGRPPSHLLIWQEDGSFWLCHKTVLAGRLFLLNLQVKPPFPSPPFDDMYTPFFFSGQPTLHTQVHGLKGRPHKNALLHFCAKTHMYCIVLADHPHGSWKRRDWKRTFLGLRVEKSENAALLFSCGQRICILSETMMPLPHPSTSSLWPLNPATSHNNNNSNNNGGLLLVFVILATYSPCSRVWVAAAVQPHYRSTQTLLVSLQSPFSSSSCFQILLPLSVCKQCASFMRMLRLFCSIFGEFQAPPRGLECELQHFESFSVDPCGCKYSWNNTEEDREKKDHFGRCGQGLSIWTWEAKLFFYKEVLVIECLFWL